jgi:hypothetical protein
MQFSSRRWLAPLSSAVFALVVIAAACDHQGGGTDAGGGSGGAAAGTGGASGTTGSGGGGTTGTGGTSGGGTGGGLAGCRQGAVCSLGITCTIQCFTGSDAGNQVNCTCSQATSTYNCDGICIIL